MLVADGVKEVMLLGQNVNSYGKNLEEPMSFAELLQEVEKIDGLDRIRFMTSHPNPRPLSLTVIELSSLMYTSTVLQNPANASSTALSTISYTR